MVDAPLLYESGMDAICGLVVAVLAPEDLRLQRILARDGITEQEARRPDGRASRTRPFIGPSGARLLVNDGDLAALQAAGGRAAGLYKPSDIRQKGVRP